MKKRCMSMVLALTLVLTLIPPAEVSAAELGVPDDFLKPVTLPLMPAADGELYDEAALELPDPGDGGFLLPVEGGEPAMPAFGLTAEVGEAPTGAAEISTAEQLQEITKGTYVLTADIDLTGKAWTPIKLSNKNSHVTLDGQGHTIRGLSVDAVTEDDFGLFRYVYGNVTIKNLRLDDAAIKLAVDDGKGSTAYGVGALVGSVNGNVTLENVAAEVAILRTGTYFSRVGGLIGEASGTVTMSDVAVQVSMSEADNAPSGVGYNAALGGIAGNLDAVCSFTRCYAGVELAMTNWSCNRAYGMGGMVGYFNNAHDVSSFTDCLSEGTLTAQECPVGGLVGGTSGGLSINNCVVDADMTGGRVGGFCANVQNYNTKSACADSRYTGTLTLETASESCIGGFFGNGSASFTGCAADVTLDITKATGKACRAGGLTGDGGGTIRSCALDVKVSDYGGAALYLGGAVGTMASTISDTLVKLDASAFTNSSMGPTRIGGLVGGENTPIVKAVNCGAMVDIRLTACNGLHAGGLLGIVDGKSSMVKCWADGVIELVSPQYQGKAYYLGGLVGSGGSMSQCYGGVELSCSANHGSTSAYGYVGGLAGNGGNMYSCWSDTTITADGKTLMSEVGGLSGSSNNRVYRDCVFSGSIDGIRAVELGGILGSCQIADFYNCYAEGDLKGGRRVGGLLGHASHATVFTDCKFEGSVTAEDGGSAGGLISCADGVLNGTSTIRRCEVFADISAPGGGAHGLAGSVKAYDCMFMGALSGEDMGGIGTSGSFYDCTATVWFTADHKSMDKYDYLSVGGICSGTAQVASNCHVTNHLYLTVYANDLDNDNALEIRFGGIAGMVTRSVDCSSAGVTISCYGNLNSPDEEIEDDSFTIYAGGIAGKINRGMENCRVSGGVSAQATKGRVYVGGLVGTSTSSSNSSSISGCVAGSTYGRVSEGTVYAGGLMGTGSDKTLISGCAAGGGMAYCGEDPKNAHSGKWTGNDKYDTGSKELNIPKRPEESYTILTFAYPDVTQSSSSTIVPLGGVAINVGDTYLGKTNSSGMLTVKRDQVDSLNMVITGSKSGYFSASSGAILAGGGSTSLYLMQKTEGKIYLTSALYTRTDPLTRTEKTMDLLTSPNSVSILQMDTEPQEFFFGVDWNDSAAKGRVLQLNNEAGNKPLVLEANSDITTMIQQHFKPNEDIYLEAKASFGGTEVTEKLKLKLKVTAVEIDMDVPGGSGDFGDGPGQSGSGKQDGGGLEFLDGTGLKIDLENLSRLSGVDISVENGTLIVEMNVGESYNEKSFLLFDGKFALLVGGKAQIPFTEEANGRWSGSARVAINGELESDSLENNQKPEKDDGSNENEDDSSKKEDGKKKEALVEWSFPTAIGPVPVTFITKFDGSLGAEIGFGGSFDQITYTTAMNFRPKAQIELRAGGGFGDEMELSLTGGGEMEALLGITMEEVVGKTGDGMKLDVSAAGRIYAALTAKAGELIDVSEEKNIGRFTWNPQDGARWYGLNNEEVEWMALPRSYLSAGGGFSGEDILPVPTVCSGSEDETALRRDYLVYDNIQNDSTAALGMEDGVPVLYFVADDGKDGAQGRAAEHTALWRSVQHSDGTWGAPVIISEGGYPDEVHADGGYAVWVESAQTESFDALLTSTNLKIAHNGAVIHTVDGGGYVHAPEITADEDGNILVVWLSDPAVNAETFLTSDCDTLQYAKYDATADQWTTGTAKTSATPTGTQLASGNTSAIYTVDGNGTVYQISGSKFNSCAERLTDAFYCTTNGTFTANIDEGGLLTVRKGSDEGVVLELGTQAFGRPVLCAEGETTYVVWAQGDGVYYADSSDNWTTIRKVCDEDGLATRLSAVIVNGRPLAAYYRSESDGSKVTSRLITACAEDISGTDLVLSELELDSRDLEQLGVVRLQGRITNRMKTVLSGYTYRVTDETGACAASGTAEPEEALALNDSTVFSILLGHDVAAQHSYTVEILPLTGTDADIADNSATVTAYAETVLAAASFRKSHEGAALEALVKNIGAAPEDSLRVEIYRADLSGSAVGTPLLTQDVNGLLPGSYQQILLDNAQSDVYYKVVLTNGEDELDSELLMWSDPEASGVRVQNVDIKQNGDASVTLLARNVDEDVQVHLVLYQDGRMVANAIQDIAPWEGSRQVGLTLDEMPVGEYTYAVYLLQRDGLIPIAPKYEAAVCMDSRTSPAVLFASVK